MKIAKLTSKNEIIKTFRALPYIVFKKKYLIPQKPSPPTFNRLSLKENLIGSFKTKYPQMITIDFLQKIKDPANHQNFIELYHKRYQIEKLEYYQHLLRYVETYIMPLKFVGRGAKPDFLYYKENKEKVEAFMKEKNIRYHITAIYEAYKALPESEKQIYQLKMQEELNKKIKLHVEAQKKYLIPTVKVPRAHILYLQEVKDTVITRDMLGEFKKQPEYIQKIYRDKYKILKEQKINERKQFLKGFNLSEAEFGYIEDICEKVRVLRAGIKKENKKLKEQSKVAVENQQEVKQESVQKVEKLSVEIRKPLETVVESKIKMSDPIIEEEYEFEFQTQQKTQKRQEILADIDDQNLDFDIDEDISLAKIKKMSEETVLRINK